MEMEVSAIDEAEATIDCCCFSSGMYVETVEPPEDLDPEEEFLETSDPESETLEGSDLEEDISEDDDFVEL